MLSLEEEKFGHLEPIDIKYGITTLSLAFILFQLLNKLLKCIGVPTSVQDDPWKWRNLFTSWIHAGICGTWVLVCFFSNPEMFDDLVSHHTFPSYLLLSFSTGYFLCDAFDLLIHNKLIKQWEVTLHHIAVLMAFIYNLVNCTCIGYNVVALAAECNTFFLHTRKLMQMHRVGFDHWAYRLNAAINLLSFIIFRGGCLSAITYGVVFYGHRITLFNRWVLGISMFIMNGINPVLFWRLLKNDFLRADYKYKRLAQNGNNNLVNNVHEVNGNTFLRPNGYVGRQTARRIHSD